MQPENFNQILFDELSTISGKIGVATLNRPEALNALSIDMILALDGKFRQWAVDPSIQAVLIQSNSERAFCAGGDLKLLYTIGKENFDATVPFFRHEYVFNRFVNHYPKPYISLIDGVTMGGGLGISILGKYVVAGENLRLAMPETGIGFYPDVGGSYFLPRCPHNIGMYMGLTGNSLNVTDALLAKLVHAHTPRNKFADIIAMLCKQDLSTDPDGKIQQVLQQFHQDPVTPSVLDPNLATIEQCFSHDSVEAVLASLEQNNSEFAKQQLEILQKRSPTSLKITHREITVGAQLDIDASMELEFNLTYKVLQGHDIYEGIRAVLIDKTHNPKWQPTRLQDVSDQLLDEIFKIQWKL